MAVGRMYNARSVRKVIRNRRGAGREGRASLTERGTQGRVAWQLDVHV